MDDLIRVEAVDRETYLMTLNGSISFSNNQVFQQALDSILAEDPKRLFIDMSAVRFCNSQGFGDMLRAYTRLSRSQGSFGLIAPTQEIRKVLEITKFSKIISIYGSRAEASV